MDSLPQLTHQFDDPLTLAHSVLARFEQLLLFVPLPEGTNNIPAIAAKLYLNLKLPDADTISKNIKIQVCCLLQPPQRTGINACIGVIIINDDGNDIEQRIRYLTHDLNAEYGKLIGHLLG